MFISPLRQNTIEMQIQIQNKKKLVKQQKEKETDSTGQTKKMIMFWQ